jgi:hypothetical protein
MIKNQKVKVYLARYMLLCSACKTPKKRIRFPGVLASAFWFIDKTKTYHFLLYWDLRT